MALLCVAVGVVIFSALPSILRAAGVGGLHEEVITHPAARLSLPPGAGLDTPRHPLFGADDEEDDEPRVTELEREYPDGMWPGRRSPEERRRVREASPERGAEDAHPPAAGGGEGRARFGIVRQAATLLAKPDEGAISLGEIRVGERVMVVKESGDWALVAYSGQDGVLMGWTKKSGIAGR